MTKHQTPTDTAIQHGSGNCLFGCGDLVGKMGKSLYKPGHDARHVGQVAPHIAEGGDDSQIKVPPTPALRAKPENMVLRLRTKAQAQADRDAGKGQQVYEMDRCRSLEWRSLGLPDMGNREGHPAQREARRQRLRVAL